MTILDDMANLRERQESNQQVRVKPKAAKEPYEAQKLRNVSPNQFALPGMEHLSHPGAPYLPHGISFEMQHDYVRRGPLPRENAGWGTQQAYQNRVPWEHHLYASQNDRSVGSLSWAGEAQERKESGAGHYPGEVTWVGRNQHTPESKGIMSAMWKMGHSMDMGQTTVPVHSPDRTSEGEQWSSQIGHPALRPDRYDFSYRPPTGTHPYEQTRNLGRQFSKPPTGQQSLPGMSHQDELWWGMDR